MEVSLEFFRHLILRSPRRTNKFSVVRMFRNGHHFYSILVTDSGFEYVFRNGHNRWSTISPSDAKRRIKHYQSSNPGKPLPTSRKQWIRLAAYTKASWEASKEVNYTSREEALLIERGILVASWEINKGIENDN